MTSSADVKTFEDIFSEGWKEINRILLDRLAVAGIEKGAAVRTRSKHGPDRYYRISRIDTDVSNGHAYCVLYGHELHADGKARKWISHIGLPHQVEVMK